jgi:ribonuclease T2
LDAINGAVGTFLADRVGAELQTVDLRERFDAAFGAGAGERVQVHCTGDGGRTLVQELKINLRGVIGPDAVVSELMLAADPLSPGCPQGVIDPAGLQ